ncbi:MAG: hypothetical protein ACLGI5_17585 [Thermoleophilia bacterium]
MAGWVFVSILLATATLLAAVTGRPLWLVVGLAVITVASTLAGARLRPDRQAAERDAQRG